MAEPKPIKKEDIYQMIDPIGCKTYSVCITNDIKSAVELFKQEIEKQEINEHGSLINGLCLNNIYYVIDILNKAFEGVMENGKKN